jgi:hypothetical protein
MREYSRYKAVIMFQLYHALFIFYPHSLAVRTAGLDPADPVSTTGGGVSPISLMVEH